MIKTIKEIIGKLTKPKVTYICDETGDIFVFVGCSDKLLFRGRFGYRMIAQNRLGAWVMRDGIIRLRTPLRKEKR